VGARAAAGLGAWGAGGCCNGRHRLKTAGALGCRQLGQRSTWTRGPPGWGLQRPWWLSRAAGAGCRALSSCFLPAGVTGSAHRIQFPLTCTTARWRRAAPSGRLPGTNKHLRVEAAQAGKDLRPQLSQVLAWFPSGTPNGKRASGFRAWVQGARAEGAASYRGTARGAALNARGG